MTAMVDTETEMRIIETLAEDLCTINKWRVPKAISLDYAMKRQENAEFRDHYFVSARPVNN